MSVVVAVAAIVGWTTVAGMLVAQQSMAAELDRLRRYRNAAEGRGYYTSAEVDEAWERLRAVVFDPDALTGCADDQTWADVPVEALREAASAIEARSDEAPQSDAADD